MYTYKAKLLRVVDGDTCDAQVDLGFDVSVKKRIRFAGINAPESRTRDLKEKAKGLAAKDRVKAILAENPSFTLESTEIGKYGRVLGKIHLNVLDGVECLTQICLNDQLVKEGHATEYHGGKR
jgi:micrococcal nuclease|tara:strand:+ start:401 stop:769 length:369 start_codon:yes stop_codon:yes gene_type:complete